MKSLVVDASVALKWFLPDERDTAKSLELLEAHTAGKLSLHAPSLLEFEIASGLTIAARRARISKTLVKQALEGFVGLSITLHPLSSYHVEVVDLCNEYGITAYDAAYVALAQSLKTDLVTADERLYAATKKLGLVKTIKRYPLK